MPSEQDSSEDGVGLLDAALASLQPALAAEQVRLAGGAIGLPRWFGPAIPVVSGECIEVLALDGAVLFVSDTGALPADQTDLGEPQPGFWLRNGNEDARRALDAAASGRPTQFQAVAETRDGDRSRWDVAVTPMRTAGGEVDAILVVSRHTISHKREESLRQREEANRIRAEALRQQENALRSRAAASSQGESEALRASAAELRLVADSMPVMISMIDRTLTYRFVNRAAADWLGLTPEQVIGRKARDVLGPDGFAWRQPYFEAALAGRESRIEADWPQQDGAPRIAEIRYLPRRDAQGGPDGFYAFVLDITDRKRAEQRLQGSAEALEAEIVRRTADRDRMWHLSADIMVTSSFDGRVEAVNPAWSALLGWTEAELRGADLLSLVHPDDQAATQAESARLAAGQRTFHFVNRLRHRDGSHRWISWSATSDERFMHAAGRDITAAREQEAARRQLEEQLRQSQKMEAVGQLTGGLAHDFNNLLTGITGSLELLQKRLAQGRLADVDRYIQAAQGAAHRAAALTHRLLAFSRRQTLDPKPTDVNQLIQSMGELIKGTAGPSIAITTIQEPDLWPTLCDPNQLENALLNLCLNARDAMPAGGRLVIETAKIFLDEQAALECDMSPGEYVSLSVSDTGAGMTPEVAARAFDPFYTTKPLGEGTGLGLSMIYGFVKQSGGQIRVYTEPGRGTMMQIFLPRHQASAVADADAAPGGGAPAAAGETVLLVDDEPAIRLLVMEVLRELGYAAIEAADAMAALATLQSDRRIDLLITDVGLPGGMNGRQLADAARGRRPALKVLFITGYAANAVDGALSPGMHVMTKPFSLAGMTAKIRAVIAEG